MPQARTRNSRPVSCTPSTEFPFRVGLEQNNAAIPLDGPEAQDLRGKRPDLPRRKVRDRHDVSTQEVLLAVPWTNGRGRFLHAMGTEIDPQLVRWVAGLRELLNADDLPDPHLNLLEVLDRDARHGPGSRGTRLPDLRASLRPPAIPGCGRRDVCRAARVPPGSSTRRGGSPRSRGPSCQGPSPRRPRRGTPRSRLADPRSCSGGPPAPSPHGTVRWGGVWGGHPGRGSSPSPPSQSPVPRPPFHPCRPCSSTSA